MAQYNKWSETGLALLDHKLVENSNMTCTAFLWFNDNTGLNWPQLKAFKPPNKPDKCFTGCGTSGGTWVLWYCSFTTLYLYNLCKWMHRKEQITFSLVDKTDIKITLYLISQCGYCGNIFKAEISKAWRNIHADKTTQIQSPTFVQIYRSNNMKFKQGAALAFL